MARSYTPFSTTAKISRGWFDGRRVNVLRQTVTPTFGQNFVTLGATLPPNARVLWWRLTNQTTVAVSTGTVQGIGTYTGTYVQGYALVAQPTTATQSATAPLSTDSQINNPSFLSATSLMVIGAIQSTASAQTARGTPLVENYQQFRTFNLPCTNYFTVPALLGLTPTIFAATAQAGAIYPAYSTVNYGVQYKSAGTVTVGGAFGTITDTNTSTNTVGTISVELFFEDYQEYSVS